MRSRRLGALRQPRSPGRRFRPRLETLEDRINPATWEGFGNIPLYFEANQGQTDAQVQYLARGPGYGLYLTGTEAVLSLQSPDREGGVEASATLRLSLLNANPTPQSEALDLLPGKSNYFIGNDPTQWQTNVAQYARVWYHEVYPGIDLVYYGNQQELEYDFIVAPNADPNSIALAFTGADGMELDPAGNLILHTAAGDVTQHAPIVYQELNGTRLAVAGGYELTADGQVRLTVGTYFGSLPLVIDPTLSYSTYLGGAGTDLANAIAIDDVGNVYLTGPTQSINFPTAGAIQQSRAGTVDIFVAKLNASGTALIYSTYLGGTGEGSPLNGDYAEQSNAIEVDADGNVYVAGLTTTENFPTTAGAYQESSPPGNNYEDAFVTKLDPSGSQLVYSTYLGGSWFDEAFGLAVDSSGNAYVGGNTSSGDFPTLYPLQGNYAGDDNVEPGGDAFVTKLNASGNALIYSTYLGGSGHDAIGLTPYGYRGDGVAVDADGNVYVTGTTSSTDFPTHQAYQATIGGGDDAFLTKINASGTGLMYSTYLGGNNNPSVNYEGATAVAVDAEGNAYITGWTDSRFSATGTPFPTTPSAPQPATTGAFAYKGFATKFDENGSLEYSTFVRGGDLTTTLGFGIAVDDVGNAYVTGMTSASNFPTIHAIQGYGGPSGGGFNGDAFVTIVNAAGTAFDFSTYLGGAGADRGYGIALDNARNIYVAGSTTSTNFPTAFQPPDPTPLQSANAGGEDVFITKIVPDKIVQFSASTYSVDETAGTATITVERPSGIAGAISVNYATSNGTATTPDDYGFTSGLLNFADRETSKTFTIPIVNDAVANEGSETINLTLSNFQGGAVPGDRTMAVLTIVDDDSQRLQFSATEYSGLENSGVVTVTVTRTNGSAGTVTVQYATSAGTTSPATVGTDYTSTSGTLTFNPGETSKTFMVGLLNDALMEGAETVNLTLSNPTDGAVLGQSTAVLTIIDDESDRLQFSPATFSVAEDGGSVAITVQRQNGTNTTVSVQYATSNGTALAGVDYAATSDTLTFAPGESSKTFSVVILDDTVYENTETITLTLSNPGGGAILGFQTTATLTITDVEAGQLQFSAGSYVVTENTASTTITVNRVGGSAGTVTVEYAATDGTALAEADYEATSGMFSFGPGETSKTFPINLMNDTLEEGNETVNLTLSNPLGGAILGTISAAILTIRDDDIINILGTPGDDLLVVPDLNRPYRMDGQGGNDTIIGGNFSDELIGGAGDDVLIGGGGDDLLDGGTGTDLTTPKATVGGASGQDLIVLRVDDDLILTSAVLTALGRDSLVSIERASLMADNGDDVLDASGFPGPVTLDGGSGDDRITGGPGDDVLSAGSGNNILDGGPGNDLEQETGAVFSLFDTRISLERFFLTGTDQPEAINLQGLTFTGDSLMLEGGAGDDTFDVSTFNGVTMFDGGAGIDLLRATDSTSADASFELAGSEIRRMVAAELQGEFQLASIEDFLLKGGSGDNTFAINCPPGFNCPPGGFNGGGGNDVVVYNGKRATLTDDRLEVMEGADTMTFTFDSTVEFFDLPGTAVNDFLDASGYTRGPVSLSGGLGDDQLLGGHGDDVISGGPGKDILKGGEGMDLLVDALPFNLTLTNTKLTQKNGKTTMDIDSLEGIERVRLTGDGSNNLLNAAAFKLGPVTLEGGAGNDKLTSGKKDGKLVGGDGADSLTGGIGNDVLEGGLGADLLKGGGGIDTLDAGVDADADVLDGGGGIDTGLNFVLGTDKKKKIEL